jgi:hypothetical protein
MNACSQNIYNKLCKKSLTVGRKYVMIARHSTREDKFKAIKMSKNVKKMAEKRLKSCGKAGGVTETAEKSWKIG